jgi:tetratricopeptide (TPR) repeat protein
MALAILLGTLSNLASAQDPLSLEPVSPELQINNRTNTERIEFLNNLAQVYFEEKDFESAMSAYERVLEIDPKNKQALYVVSHVYIDAKAYGKAETLLLQLIEENPEDFKLKNNLAWLYATAEDPKYRNGIKAIAIAQEAMVLAPNDHHVWSTLSEAYYISGDYEKAHRAIVHMASLAARYGQDITKEQVDSYNEQIRKCKRAWDTQKMLEGDDED